MSYPLNAVVWAWLLLEECSNPVLRPKGTLQNFCETEKGRGRRKRKEEVGGRRGNEGEGGRESGSGWKEVGGKGEEGRRREGGREMGKRERKWEEGGRWRKGWREEEGEG